MQSTCITPSAGELRSRASGPTPPAAVVDGRRLRGAVRRLRRPAALPVSPAAFLQEPVGIQLADVGRALPAELDPCQLILRRDERQRAASLTHPCGADDPVR